MVDSTEREVLFVADPMCSWCWGFAPTLRSMAELAQGRVDIRLMMGGLRPLTREPMDENQKAETRHHWESVAERSGQHFDFGFFERESFVYDTEPACRAVVVVRTIAPPLALEFFEAVQRAFYSVNRDVTDFEVLHAIARKCGVDSVAFETRYAEIASAYETSSDFHSARQLNVTGYPTVIFRQGNEFGVFCAGYQPWDTIRKSFEDWLNS